MCEPLTKQDKEGTLMIVSILFGIVLFLTSYAEAHRGNPCLDSDYASSAHGCERDVVNIKPDPYHFDSSRLYAEDEEHRHLPRALGDPRVDYTITISEWYGWGSSGAEVELGHISGYLYHIPLFDRDLAFEAADTCYLVESTGIVDVRAGGISLQQRLGHPFSEEGYTFHKDARGYGAGLIEFVRYGGGFDYEKAPFEDNRGKYYEYTVTAWDRRDAKPQVTSCWQPLGVIRPSDSSLEISNTFRVYVIDEDESVNHPPVIDESDLSNLRIFENAPVDTVICCDWPDVDDPEDIDWSHHDWTFELLGDDASAFRIINGRSDSSLNAVLNGLMYSTRPFDYETQSEYHLTFKVTDSDGGVDEADFTIRVIDLVNESCAPPTINWPHSPAPWNFTGSATHIESVPDVTSWNDPNCSTARSGGGSNSGGGSSTGNRGGGSNNGGSSSGGGGGGGSVGGVGSTGERNTGGEIGHVDFCRDFGPCDVGEGDCDSTSECESGLQCSRDIGARYGFQANYDVCEATPNNVGHVEFCQDEGPCNVGEGDCDSTNECESGLQCSWNVGAGYGLPSNYDVCEANPEREDNGHVDYCRDYGPCSTGEGDCDSTSECESGLQCSWNIGASYGFPPSYDVCE